ncbi:MAG: sulfur transferase domain-containing protein [Phycisphaerales bacterium]
MLRLIGTLMASGLIAFLPGCGGYRTHDPFPLSLPPQDIGDWEGVPRLSRAWNVLFAGQPMEEGFRLLAERGVKIVVNLRPNAEMQRAVDFDEATFVESLGMEYVHIPMTPATFSADDVARLKAVIYRLGAIPPERFRFVIHCRSSNRCGGLWAAFLHETYRFKESKAIEYGKLAGLRSESMIEATKRVMNG